MWSSTLLNVILLVLSVAGIPVVAFLPSKYFRGCKNWVEQAIRILAFCLLGITLLYAFYYLIFPVR